jgi:hypothetical protein
VTQTADGDDSSVTFSQDVPHSEASDGLVEVVLRQELLGCRQMSW